MKEAKHLKDWTKILLLTAMVLLLLVFSFSGYKLLTYYVNSKKEAEAFDKLAQMVERDMVLQSSWEETEDSKKPANEDGPVILEPDSEENAVLSQYARIYELNQDLFGWISISGTKINYPVMHTPSEPEYYLRRAYDKTYSISGVPFLSANCYEGSGNYLVYGHNMNDGSMFASLTEYEDKKFFEAHKVIEFDTLYEEAEYEVMAVFKAKLKEAYKSSFRYWEYTDLTDTQKFEEYINNVSSQALYDTGLSAEFGDEILTLSTCESNEADARFVVVAKKCKQ